MTLFEVAYLFADGKPSVIRLSEPTDENTAAHKAIEIANDHEFDTCVVKANTDEVIQTIRYYPVGHARKVDPRVNGSATPK